MQHSQPKRRSTLDPTIKQKRQKIQQNLFQLDKCLQIPNDDKMIVRKLIKQEEERIIDIFQMFRGRKDNQNMTQLQIKVRKYLQIYKTQQKMQNHELNNINKSNCLDKDYKRIYSQNSQQPSYKNSCKISPQKQDLKKKVINLDIGLLKQKIEHSIGSHRVSVKNSLTQEHQTFRNVFLPAKNGGLKGERSAGRLGLASCRIEGRNKNSRSYLLRSTSKEKITQGNLSNLSILNASQDDRNKSKTRPPIREPSLNTSLSKKTIRIGPKPQQPLVDLSSFQNIKMISSSSRPLADLTSYSSNIKNLLTNKIKEQKQGNQDCHQHDRSHGKIFIREEGESYTQNSCIQSQQESSKGGLQFAQISAWLAKNTMNKQEPSKIKVQPISPPKTMKRPARPLLKDSPHQTPTLFTEDPIFIHSDNSDGRALTLNSQIPTARSNNDLEYSFKQNGYFEKSRQKGNEENREIDQGHFLRKIRMIMQNAPL